MWNYFRGSNRLPLLPAQREAPDDECVGRPNGGLFCFRSGDARTNQQVPLVVLHTLHTRQHNRLAAGLALVNPHWSGERLYQEARHIHVAQIQHLLLSEYLPLLLGERLLEKFSLLEAPDGQYWDNYDPQLNAGISQEFAAAAFRQGHSSVPSEVFRVDVTSRLPRHLYRLRELFRQPWPVFEPGAVDEFLLGLTESAGQQLDPFVSSELSGHLLEEPDEPVGLDLIAINIQRGELLNIHRALEGSGDYFRLAFWKLTHPDSPSGLSNPIQDATRASRATTLCAIGAASGAWSTSTSWRSSSAIRAPSS